MPEVSPQPNTPQPNTPQVVTKKAGFNWKSVLIAVLIGAMVIIAATTGLRYYLDQNQSHLETGSVTIKSATPAAQKDNTAGWKIYTNYKYGYSLKYPTNWYIKSSSGGNAENNGCDENLTTTSIIELSATAIEDCGFIREFLPPSTTDITILVSDTAYADLTNILTDRPSKDTTIAGIKAVKYIHTKDSSGPDVNDTRIYFNYNNSGYLIYLKQSDQIGSYDTIYDTILSTFKFL